MQATQQQIDTKRYAKCVEVSKRIRWDIDRDVIRGRKFDFAKKFLPDGLSQGRPRSTSSARTSGGCSARSRAAPTPTSSAWSSASSAPRCSR